jgi:hypothetical protein
MLGDTGSQRRKRLRAAPCQERPGRRSASRMLSCHWLLGGFYSLQGNGPFWGGPSVSGDPPWTSFSSLWRAQYTATGRGGSLNMSVQNQGLVFSGIPADRAVWPLCFPGGLLERSIFTYAVAALPSRNEVVAAVLLCDSPHTKQTWGTKAEPTKLSAPSLVAFASPADGSGK